MPQNVRSSGVINFHAVLLTMLRQEYKLQYSRAIRINIIIDCLFMCYREICIIRQDQKMAAINDSGRYLHIAVLSFAVEGCM
jgi:hypothetical protein